MAGDWIKMRHDLTDDPSVIRLVETTTCVDECHVVGVLHKLWSWVDRQSRNGYAAGVTLSWLDRYLGVTGFAQALIEVGWLKVKGDGFSIPKFDAHNSKSAKNRALSAARMKRKRYANGVTSAQPEKRREEKNSLVDRSIERRKLESIDWGKAGTILADAAKRLMDGRVIGRLTPKLGEQLHRAAALVQAGLMPPAILADTIDAMVSAKPSKPTAYLGKTLANKWGDWDETKGLVEIP